MEVTGRVDRSGASPTIHLAGSAVGGTRAEVRVVKDGVRWEGRGRMVATPGGSVLMLPTPVEGLVSGDCVTVMVRPSTRQPRVPEDIASVLSTQGLAPERWSDPDVRHLVRWVAEAAGAVRIERLDVLRHHMVEAC